MISALYQHEFFGSGGGRQQSFKLYPRAVLILASADEQLGLAAIAQECVTVAAVFHAHRCARRDQRHHARLATCGLQSRGRTERKPSKDERQAKLSGEPIESGADVFDFPTTEIVLTCAQPGATKIKTKDRKSK